MLIPHWLVATFTWIILSTAAAITGGLCAWGWTFAVKKAIKAWEETMTAIGLFAAFWNFAYTIIRAADGGREWVNEFLHPADPDWRTRRDPRSYRLKNPSLYFAIKPHPEAWRWWMRPFGVKKPR